METRRGQCRSWFPTSNHKIGQIAWGQSNDIIAVKNNYIHRTDKGQSHKASKGVRRCVLGGMRKPRALKVGALYHVTARANRKELILDEKGMRDLFLTVIVRAKKRYNFKIENFCLMGNHFHLMIRPGLHESLSRIMQWIMSVFAMTFNRMHGYTGHVWGCRFFSRILGRFREYAEVYRYIDKNPVAASRVRSSKMWRYGGLWHDTHGDRRILDPPTMYALMISPAHMAFSLPE